MTWVDELVLSHNICMDDMDYYRKFSEGLKHKIYVQGVFIRVVFNIFYYRNWSLWLLFLDLYTLTLVWHLMTDRLSPDNVCKSCKFIILIMVRLACSVESVILYKQPWIGAHHVYSSASSEDVTAAVVQRKEEGPNESNRHHAQQLEPYSSTLWKIASLQTPTIPTITRIKAERSSSAMFIDADFQNKISIQHWSSHLVMIIHKPLF